MAKFKRLEVGSVVKGKDGKPPYIKVNADVHLKKGDFLNLESKANQIKGIEAAAAAGKLPEELAAKLLESAHKTPDFVLFKVVQLNKTED